jgi:hypothetical protein
MNKVKRTLSGNRNTAKLSRMLQVLCAALSFVHVLSAGGFRLRHWTPIKMVWRSVFSQLCMHIFCFKTLSLSINDKHWRCEESQLPPTHAWFVTHVKPRQQPSLFVTLCVGVTDSALWLPNLKN